MRNRSFFKRIKIKVYFKDGSDTTFSHFTAIPKDPQIVTEIIWNPEKHGLDGGILAYISLIDNDKEYEFDFTKENVDVEEGHRLTLYWPNEQFIAVCKKTNVIHLSLCLDKIPKSKIKEYVESMLFRDMPEIHHVNFLERMEGYYTEED